MTGVARNSRFDSLLAGVAALSVANLEAFLTRPHAFTITVLARHGLTMALLIAILMQAGLRTAHLETLKPS